MMCLYVEDLMIIYKTAATYSTFVEELKAFWRITQTPRGHCTKMLGLQITRNNEFDVTLDQPAMINELLDAHGMQNSKPVAAPGSSIILNLRLISSKEKEDVSKLPIRNIIGS